MTNIIEIITKLNEQGYHFDIVIKEGHIYVLHHDTVHDITQKSFAEQLHLVAYCIEYEWKTAPFTI